MHNVLLYFVKYPEPGKVKTRLAQAVGKERAAELYRELAEKNLHAVTERHGGAYGNTPLRRVPPRHFHLIVAYDPPDKIGEFRDWLGEDFEYWPQRGEGLGERLRAAFQQAFDEGASQVLAFGIDTLNFLAEILSQAFEA